jgi:hypothetical protein
LVEGSADFIGEFISGEHINPVPFQYGRKMLTDCLRICTYHEAGRAERLVVWSEQKDDRPNDLGYWIGYKITEAYFNKQTET